MEHCYTSNIRGHFIEASERERERNGERNGAAGAVSVSGLVYSSAANIIFVIDFVAAFTFPVSQCI